MSVDKTQILVTGATTQIGGALVRLLAGESGLHVAAAARSPGRAKGLGVPVVQLDYDRGETLAPGPSLQRFAETLQVALVRTVAVFLAMLDARQVVVQ
jgi:uncharacterized protein YbjT (DUF2867 family)